jgi:hypothetical protein
MPAKHHSKRRHHKTGKKTVKKHNKRHTRRHSHKKQMGGSPASHAVMEFVNTSGPALDDYAVGMELPSMDKISKCATQQMGGSLVSDAVMSAKMGMTDYQEQADLPAMSQLGGAGCGAPKQAGGASACGSTTPENLLGNGNLGQKGGSPASDRLDSFTQLYNTSTLNEKKGDVITADMIPGDKQPALYQLTGGKGRKGKGRKRTQKMMKMPGQKGGSFWNMAGCGPWNGTDAGRKYADYFSKTSKCPGPEWYANPPELPKAGSGDAADLAIGATYPFA